MEPDLKYGHGFLDVIHDMIIDNNNGEERGFVYVLDVSCDAIYCVHLYDFHLDYDDVTSEDIEKLLSTNGFNLDEISYMITEYKQDIIDVFND